MSSLQKFHRRTNGVALAPPDTIPPSVTITSNTYSLIGGQTATITATFSEPVTGFIQSDLLLGTAGTGTFSNFAVDNANPTIYTATFTPTPNTTVVSTTVRIAANAYTDLATPTKNNGAAATIGTAIALSMKQPTVTITSDTAGQAFQDFTLTFTLSMASSNFVSDDVTLSGGTKGTWTAVSTTVYTLVVTPPTGSTTAITALVAAGALTSTYLSIERPNVVSNTLTQQVATVPRVTITSNVAVASMDGAIITFTTSVATADFTTADVTVTNGTKGTFTAVSSTVYTLTVTPPFNTSTAITISVANAAFSSGGLSSAANTFSQAVNTTPGVTMTASPQIISSNQNTTITATFNIIPTGFAAKDISYNTGTVTGPTATGNPRVFTLAFSNTAGSTVIPVVAISAGSWSSSYTPTIPATSYGGASITLATDLVAPTVTATSSALTLKAGQTATITITFSEVVTGFTVDDIVLTSASGTLSNFAAAANNNSIYTCTFTPTPNTTQTNVKFNIPGGSATDAAGNPNVAATNQASITLSVVRPTVAITDDNTGTAGPAVNYTFTLSEASSDFVVGDITVGNGTKGVLARVSPSVYTLPVTPTVNATGNMTVDVPAGTFTNAAGNSNLAATQNVQPFDTMPISVTLSSSLAVYKQNSVGTITATFNKVPVGFELKDLTSDNGTFGSFAATTDTKVFTATFTPTPGSTVSNPGIGITAGSYKDAANNNGAAGVLTGVTMDMISPTVTITSSVATVKKGQTATITFTFSESVTGFTITDIVCPNGTMSNFLGSGTTYTALFTPTPESTATSSNITISAGTYTDVAGNSGTAGAKPSLSMAVVSPGMTIATTSATATTTTRSFNLSFTSTEATSNFATAMPWVFSITGVTYSAFTTVSPSVYTLKITGAIGLGACTITVPAGAFTSNSSGNTSLVSNVLTVTF
jgi:hypothetical protein